MFKKLFNRKTESITGAAALVAFFSLASRLLGVLRDRIFAGEFGAGETLDIYFAAFRIPDFLFNIIILGALSAGFIPIFSGLTSKIFSNKKAWRFASNLLNILILGLLVFSILGIIFAPFLIKIIAPGFSAENQKITADLARIMFLSPLFLGISGILSGILQTFKRFLAYSVAPLMYNLGIIFGALFLFPIWGIYGLAWGVVFGAALHAAIQVPAVLALGFRYQAIINWRDKSIRKIGYLMIPRLMSLISGQINLLVITVIASTLSSGSLAVFNFANNLQAFPMGIFGISFAIAAFPTLSAQAQNTKEFIKTFSFTFRKVLFFIVPSTVLLLTLRAQIIRVILGTGQFDWEDTLMTIDTLGFFALSLFAQATIPLLARMFFARHNSKTPFYIGLLSMILNIVLSYHFSKILGVSGLALAFSIASIVNFILLWIFIRDEIGPMDEFRILVSTVKFSAAAVGCGIAVQGIKIAIWPFVDMTKLWGVLVQGGASGLVGILIYLILCKIFKSEELEYVVRKFRKIN